jgi:hypothetical protein
MCHLVVHTATPSDNFAVLNPPKENITRKTISFLKNNNPPVPGKVFFSGTGGLQHLPA